MKLSEIVISTKPNSAIKTVPKRGDITWIALGLISLKNSPETVNGSFLCPNNKLKSLEHGPTEVISGNFNCSNNKLISLEHGPTRVDGEYNCGENKLSTLQGAPTSVGSNFLCTHNELTSLEGIPEKIGGGLFCRHNKLTSLKGIHLQIKEVCTAFINNLGFDNNPIKSHVLGLLKIKGISYVSLDNNGVADIINRHLAMRERDIFACQEELEDAGFEEYAKL